MVTRVFAQRVERGFDDVVVLRIQREVAERIDYAVVVGRPECGDRASAKFEIRFAARDAEDDGSHSLAAVAAEQCQRRAFATNSLRRTRLEPFGGGEDPALQIRLKQRLKHDDLELTRIVVGTWFTRVVDDPR